MKMRLPLLLLAVIFALPFADFAVAQNEDGSAGSEQQTDQESTEPAESADATESEEAAAFAEPPPPATPTITRSTGGIIVVTGAGSGTPTANVEPDSEEPKTDDEATPTEEPVVTQEQAPEPATEAKGPKSRTVSKYGYGPSGQQRTTGITVSSTNDGTSRSSTSILTNLHGQAIPYLTESEKVFNETPGEKVTEKRTHRYDTAGNPVSQQVVREEQRLLPDGTRQKTTTVYESDINGRMIPVDRTIENTKKVGNVMRSTTTAERPDVNKRFKVYERAESERTLQGDAVATEKSSRKVDNGLGTMIEVERTESAMSRSGGTATTETKVWKRGVVNSDRLELAGRTVGKLVERQDGSSEETVEVFASSSGGSATNLNASGDHDLQQRIQRETRKATDGSTVESTTTQSRSIADPSRFGGKATERRVKRPTASGETIETHSYEQGVNGRLQPTGSTVETIETK